MTGLAPARRAALLLAWLLAMALGGWVIVRSHYSADLSAFLPASPDARAQLLIEQLNSGVAARSLLLGITGGDAAARAEASRRLAALLRRGADFEAVHNGESTDWQAGGAADWLVRHRYHLSPAVNAQRFTAAGLRDAVDDTLALLGTPAGALVKPLLARDPTGETQRIAESLLPGNAPRSQHGVWVSRSAPRALLLLQTRASGADLDGQAALIDRLQQSFDQAVSGAPAVSGLSATGAAPAVSGISATGAAPAVGGPSATGAASAVSGASATGAAPAVSGASAAAAAPALAGLALQISGPPVFAVQSRARIETEVRQLAIAGTVLMGALLLLAFGSVAALVVAFLPVASGVVAGIVAVSLAFGTVHGLTLGFGSTLIGEAVDYAIYFLIQARGAGPGAAAGAAAGGAAGMAAGMATPQHAPGTGFRRWQRQAWPTVRLGLLTSVCGFAALLFSGFPGLAQLGVFSIAGLLAAALATRWVLPALMPDGAAGTAARRRLGRVTARAVRGLPRWRAMCWLLGAASLALLLWQRGALWQGDLASLSPVPRAALALDAELRTDLAASDARTLVVVQGADAQAALRAAERAGHRLDALVASGQLAGYDSPARFLPSLATQQARLASLPDAATLQARLAQALEGSPLAAARLAPFVAEASAAHTLPLLDRAALAGSPLAPLADALLVPRRRGVAGPPGPPDEHGWLALLALQPGAQPLQADAVRAALAGLPEAQVIDIKAELDRLYQGYLAQALWQSALGALAVVALLAAALRSGRRLLAVCQPLVLAVLITLAGLSLAGVTLGILHLVGLLLVVAVGSNYALFFDQFFGPGRAPGPASAGGGAGVGAGVGADVGADGAAGDAADGAAGDTAAAPAADDDWLASLLLANLTTVASFGLIAGSQIPALSAIGQVVAPGALLALLLSAVFVRAPPAPRRARPAPPHGAAGV